MRLKVNVITGKPSRYYKAGEDVPNDLLSDSMRRFAMADPHIGADDDTHVTPPRG
jgi:hypothetical protein